MEIIKTPIHSLFLLQPKPHRDNRGFFAECFTQRELDTIGHKKPILQVNHSCNAVPGTLRGMHFQKPPHAEIKIVKCVHGAIFDVALDIRKNSPTYLQWYGTILNNENMHMLYIPEGFAHGYQTLEPDTEVIYFTTAYYSPDHLGGLRFDDPRFGIDWLLPPAEMSERDRNHLIFEDQPIPF